MTKRDEERRQDWHLDMILEDATVTQMQAINRALIDICEAAGLYIGGSCLPWEEPELQEVDSGQKKERP